MKAGAGLSHLSCLRFLWTPYCPEKLEDDSVEGDGKTMIGAAGLVGSEGERSSSMLSITGQAAGAGPLAPGQRWSLARKHEVVLRLLRGEPVEAAITEDAVPFRKVGARRPLACCCGNYNPCGRVDPGIARHERCREALHAPLALA